MSFAKQSFSIFTRDLILLAVNILTSAIIARTLGPEMMGVWAILQLLPSFAEAFGRIKIDIAAVYFLGKGRAELNEVIFLVNAMALLFAGVVVLVILLAFEWIYGHLFGQVSFDASQLALWMLPAIPLQFLYMNYSYYLLHLERIASYNLMVILQAFTNGVVALSLLLIWDFGVLSVVWALSGGLAVAGLYGAFTVRKVARMKFRFDLALAGEMMIYAFKLYLSGLVSHFQSYIINLITALYLLPQQIAFFSMAKGRAELITSKIPQAINSLLLPKVMKQGEEDAGALVAKSFRVILLFELVIGVLLAIFIKPLVWVLYGPEFFPMIEPFWILLPGLVLSKSAMAFNSYFASQGHPMLMVKLAIGPLILQVGLAWWAMQHYGAEGAAASFLGGMIFLVLLQVVWFKRLSKLPFGQICPGREDVSLIWNFGLSLLKRFKKTPPPERID